MNELLDRAGVFWSGLGRRNPSLPFKSRGRFLASDSFARALARHSRIHQLDFFVDEMDDIERKHELQTHLSDPDLISFARTEVYSQTDLASCFKTNAYDIVHDPIDFDLSRMMYLRASISDHFFPITCMQRWIYYQPILLSRWVQLLTAHMQPCDAIVCSNSAARTYLEKRMTLVAHHYGGLSRQSSLVMPRLEVIHPGIDIQVFSPSDRMAARQQLRLPIHRQILLSIIRADSQVATPYKMDCMPLLLALTRIKERLEMSPLLVILAPTMAYTAYLMQRASHLGVAGDIRVIHDAPRACLPGFLTACDIFVLPADSHSENDCLTVLEAMACGRPVVASDWAGYKELIVHGQTGFKVRTDWADCLHELNEHAPFLSWEQEHLHFGQSVSVDVAEMARYLLTLLEARELREAMGELARARVEANYAWPTIIACWEALWTELSGLASQMPSHFPTARWDYLRPDHFQHFSHYASRIIGSTTQVGLTARGNEVAETQSPLWVHPLTQGFLDGNALQSTLQVITKDIEERAGQASLEDLLTSVTTQTGITRDQALMHVMWLAKYDLTFFHEDLTH
jgi:glycosyltransferase involved in cell wall biosynthesis